MVWGPPLPVPLVVWVRPFSGLVAPGGLHGAGQLQISAREVRTSTGVGGQVLHCSSVWSLTVHSSSSITLPQIPLNLGEDHFAGAGVELAQARIIIHGLLNGLLNPHRAQPGCTGPGYERACQQHMYVRDAAMAQPSPPPAVFKIKIMPYSSLQRDQPHLCSALPSLGQRRRALLPAEGEPSK